MYRNQTGESMYPKLFMLIIQRDMTVQVVVNSTECFAFIIVCQSTRIYELIRNTKWSRNSRKPWTPRNIRNVLITSTNSPSRKWEFPLPDTEKHSDTKVEESVLSVGDRVLFKWLGIVWKHKLSDKCASQQCVASFPWASIPCVTEAAFSL